MSQPTPTDAENNPLLEGLRVRRAPEPCALTIFGASGDLAQRKLMPALYSLAFRRLLPERFAIVGAARSDEGDDAFRGRMRDAVREHARDPFEERVWEPLEQAMHYSTLDFSDDSAQERLDELLVRIDREHG